MSFNPTDTPSIQAGFMVNGVFYPAGPFTNSSANPDSNPSNIPGAFNGINPPGGDDDSDGGQTPLFERVNQAFWPTMRVLTIIIAAGVAVAGTAYAFKKIQQIEDKEASIQSALKFISCATDVALGFCDDEINSSRDFSVCLLKNFAKISELILRSSLLDSRVLI